jgi:3-methylcrotonyl-CoA carboxylase beta subunit
MCGRAYDPRLLWMWPNARISVMGGEQAAQVLTRVHKEGAAAKGAAHDDSDEAKHAEAIRAQYAAQAHPYYASARLWDDGIITPSATRDVLGRCLALALRAPIPPTRFGVFRM